LIEFKGRDGLKIFHIITGLDDGGAEAVLYRLCVHDRMHRHSVVSLMDDGKYGPLLANAGIAVFCLRMPRGRLTVRGFVRLWRLLQRERPDVVQTWMYHADLVGGAAARLAGIQRIFWGIRHTALQPDKSRRVTILLAKLNAWLSHRIPLGIVCCAESSREAHKQLGYAPEKLTVIPNGYDLSAFRPDPLARQSIRSEFGIPADIPLIGMVGRFDPQKDHKNFLNALGLLKKAGIAFRCLLVGSGLNHDNADVSRWMEHHGVAPDVLLVGQRSDIPAVMNALDVFALSSSTEAFPNVLAEAMACGTPCVTTDVGDAATIVGDTGWVVPPRDSPALAGALQRALAARIDAAAWANRSEAARMRVEERYSLQSMILAYHSAWLQGA
jgi:glycosyltransferase involved in cell wall biosynthesis